MTREREDRGRFRDVFLIFGSKHDPTDPEGSYQRPIPAVEYLRGGLKIAAVAAAGAWFRLASNDRIEEGAELTIAAGFVLVIFGVVDLIYLRKHEIELIFFTRRAQQVAVRWAMLIAGLLLVGAGLASYGS